MKTWTLISILFFSFKSFSSPDPVNYGGYFTSLSNGYNQKWLINPNEEITIEVIADSSGVLDVYSPTILSSSNIYLTLGTEDGEVVSNPVYNPLYGAEITGKHFYVTQEQLAANNNKLFVHLSNQRNSSAPFHDLYVMFHSDDDFQPFDEGINLVKNVDLREFYQTTYNHLMRERHYINENTRARQDVIHGQMEHVYELLAIIDFIEEIKQYELPSNELNEALLQMWIEHQFWTYLVIAFPDIEYYLDQIDHLGYGLNYLRAGNLVVPIVIAEAKLIEAGVLAYGIYEHLLVQEDINALFLVNEVMRIALENDLPIYDNDELTDMADIYGAILTIEHGCSIVDLIFMSCYVGLYDELFFLEKYRNLEANMLRKISLYQGFQNKFEDTDFDGYTNHEELADEGDPNDPDVIPQSELNQCPLISISLNSNNIEVGEDLIATAIVNDVNAKDTLTNEWFLYEPGGSNAVLSNTDGLNTSFVVDEEGSFTLKLKTSDGTCVREATKVITGFIEYDEDDLVLLDGDTIYFQHGGDIDACEMDHMEFENSDYVEVPQGEIWRQIKMGGSEQDVILVLRSGQRPERDDHPIFDCEAGYPAQFNADFEYDLLVDRNGFVRWEDDHFGGDKIYAAVFSYEGVPSLIPFPAEIRIDIDIDGDQVPDDQEDPACVNNSSEQFDTDNDGTCNGEDAFENDPAASIDTDTDGYPNAWNPSNNESDSTTGLTLDVFPNNANEWSDSDNDGVGDNSDKFPGNPAASLDSDDDGYPDILNTNFRWSTVLYVDAFIFDPAASIDTDSDGYPDQWNPGKNADDSTTGLVLDQLPNDPNEYIDTDGDGIGDGSDIFPTDPSEWFDSDGDGVGDNADAAPHDKNRQVNFPPEIIVSKNGPIVAGETSIIELSMSDADGDSFNVTIPSGTALPFLELNDGISLTPEDGLHVGQYHFVIHVVDELGAQKIENVVINVLQRFSISLTQHGFGSYQLLVNGEEIICNRSCNVPSFDGAINSLELIPQEGTEFLGWGGDCSGSGTCVLNMNKHKSVNIHVWHPDIIFMDSF